jgi:hypothetical protein
MKIRTKLQLIILVNILMLVGIVSVSLLWQAKANGQFKQQALAMELQHAIFEEGRLLEEYFQHREDRPKEQYLLIQTKIRELLERLSGIFTGSEENIHLTNMASFHTRIGAFFDQLVKLDESATDTTATAQALRGRIINQMLVDADFVYREGLRLLSTANEKTIYQNKLFHLYSSIAFGLLALVIVSFAVIIIRSITYPLKRLNEATEIIARAAIPAGAAVRATLRLICGYGASGSGKLEDYGSIISSV